MSGAADLPEIASSYDTGTLTTADGMTAVENRDWKWTIGTFIDLAGNVIDLTGCTAVCSIYDAIGGSSLVTTSCSVTSTGQIIVTATAANTAGKAGAATAGSDWLRCVWGLKLTIPGGAVVQVFGPDEFRIAQEVA